MDLILTEHAQKRMNQRSISKEMVELIYEYGREEYDNNGGIRIIITKKMIKSLIKRIPPLAKFFEKVKGIYLVISSHTGAVLTTGHRYA